MGPATQPGKRQRHTGARGAEALPSQKGVTGNLNEERPTWQWLSHVGEHRRGLLTREAQPCHCRGTVGCTGELRAMQGIGSECSTKPGILVPPVCVAVGTGEGRAPGSQGAMNKVLLDTDTPVCCMPSVATSRPQCKLEEPRHQAWWSAHYQSPAQPAAPLRSPQRP